MRALVSTLAAAATAVLLLLPMSTPAGAQERAVTAEITQVQYRHHDRWRSHHRWRDHHYGRRHHWRHRHRRHHDPGLSFGIIIAPPPIYYSRPRYVAPRPHYRHYGGGHVQWCYARYRSYRAYDNTYQPYHGPRRPCYSPYS